MTDGMFEAQPDEDYTVSPVQRGHERGQGSAARHHAADVGLG
jgi:hypothetical protein